jgi:succinate dehydrogenase/fumarate reductase flavoprotein subunit
MVAHEGKTRIPVYEGYTAAGFDPDKDMLQAVVMPPDLYRFSGWHQSMGMAPPQWRSMDYGVPPGLVVDWDFRTNLEGLYAAGTIARAGGCAGACASGRYVGRKIFEYVKAAPETVIDRKQVDREKERVYAPVKRQGKMGWKELQAGIARIMQDYCGEYKSETLLRTGLKWLQSIREGEAANAGAKNPHELIRVLECLSRITVGEMVMHASLAHKASSRPLNFNRMDYPEMDPPEWNKFPTTRLENGEVKTGELPLKYWLLPPNAPTYTENYEKHGGL